MTENRIGVGDQARGPMSGEYRFPKDFEPPTAPEGKVVTKFHGDVAFISSPREGESKNAAGFTPTQVADLQALESHRVQGSLDVRPTHFMPITIVELPQS